MWGASGTLQGTRLNCHEGDPACDVGTTDGVCDIRVFDCLNRSSGTIGGPGVCAATDVRQVALGRASLSGGSALEPATIACLLQRVGQTVARAGGTATLGEKAVLVTPAIASAPAVRNRHNTGAPQERHATRHAHPQHRHEGQSRQRRPRSIHPGVQAVSADVRLILRSTWARFAAFESPGDRVSTQSAEQAILVVDDEPASVNLLRITLGMDYRVHTATGGEAALELFANEPGIALAIVDQRMPGMSGTEFIQHTIDQYPHLIRIILTGYTDVESLIQAINAGRVYRYLTKPWNRDELVGIVRQGLDVHRLALDNALLQDELRAANARLVAENVHLKREAKGRPASTRSSARARPSNRCCISSSGWFRRNPPCSCSGRPGRARS